MAAVAMAANSHVLDPTLSLTGGTGTTVLDPVPDPGTAHPAKPFDDPCGVTTDAYGDIYVANGATSSLGAEGRIDIFGADGELIGEVPGTKGVCALAVDSTGVMYGYLGPVPGKVVRYVPTTYEPAQGKIAYPTVPTVIAEGSVESFAYDPAVDPSNDHLFLARADSIEERAANGSLVTEFGDGSEFREAKNIDVWGQNHDVAISASPGGSYNPLAARAFVLDGTSHAVKLGLDGSAAPNGGFGFTASRAAVAFDQGNGDLYVGDLSAHHAVDQFDVDGNFIGQIKLGNSLINSEPYSDIAVDQGEFSPNRGYVYVTSGFQTANSHLYAFAPLETEAPDIRDEHAEEASESDALLVAELNPHGSATTYHFEYGPEDCATATCQSVPAGGGDGGAGGEFQRVAAPVSGLTPGTTYHFRLVASSHCNPTEPEEECIATGPGFTFRTFPVQPAQACPNEAFRHGFSARLPDCRAFELVTPAETNGRVPTAALFGELQSAAPVLLASEDGESLLFGTEGGALPDIGGGGYHDVYRAARGPGGWGTEFVGLDGGQAQEPFAVGASADHRHLLWTVQGSKGSLAESTPTGPRLMRYTRGPGGEIQLIGIGSLGTDSGAEGFLVSPDGSHLIFANESARAVRLEPAAPPSGTPAIYDRSASGGPTRVVSLLPGDQTPAGAAGYLGASPDGTAVVFTLEEGGEVTMYERLDNAETVEIVSGKSTFAGVSRSGDRVFYLVDGNLFAFDSRSHTVDPIGSGGETTVVNVPASGERAYFVSPVVLTGSETNARGATATPGGENLYAWSAATDQVRYVATLEESDVAGEEPPPGSAFEGQKVGGLGLWTSDALSPRPFQSHGPANDPSRADPSGEVFVFESRAQLTDYDNEGHTEVYRYDAGAGQMTCISCNPSNGRAETDARLEARFGFQLRSIPPVNAVSLIDNVVAGGSRIYFESGDALSFEDTDTTNDVYEWEAEGQGSCHVAAGCVLLLSSGRSAGPNFLYGVGASGRDVFFWSTDQLTDGDTSAAPSLYDARVEGGFPSAPAPVPCREEACQGALASPPALPTPGSVASAPRKRKPVHRPRKKHKKQGKRHKQKAKHHDGKPHHSKGGKG
jgi:hypothetical protein